MTNPSPCPPHRRLDRRFDEAIAQMRPGHLALREPTLWRYREVLPLGEGDGRVSLGEGFTPLLAARRLGARLGLPRLAVKEEGGNPTGSFKARGLSTAVSMARALGATDVCLPSAGNAGSALAAYAAAAGLRAHVFLPKDIPRLFVLETEAYGAHVEMVDGLITDAGRLCAAQAKEHGWYECATIKEPYRVEGKKTMGYELAEQLDRTLPDAILYPTGGGTGLVGMWKAFAEMETMGFVGPKRPRMYAVQAEKFAGCSVAEIQALYGVNAYRRYERRALEEAIQIYPEAVIATPGGLVSDPATFNLLLAHCTTVWLQADPEDHMRRVVAQGDMRPMAASKEAMEDLKGILSGRAAFYSKAEFRLDTSAQPLQPTFVALRAMVREALGLAMEPKKHA